MKTRRTIDALLGVTLVLGVSTLAGCTDSGASDADGGTDGTGGMDDDGDDGDDGPTSNTAGPSTGSATDGPDPGDDDGVDSSGGMDDDADDGDTGDTGGEMFDFPNDPYDAYTQIDRHAAVEAGTAGIAGPLGLGFGRGADISIRDEYNASNPAEDAEGMWLGEISASVTFFHGALDDDLVGLGLVPATVDEALAQAGPVIVPDTIKYDPSQPTAYPNGRTLEDPVVDITLAAVLLQLGPTQPLSFLADLPLNPPANDVPFEAEFPYLAPPHAPK